MAEAGRSLTYCGDESMGRPAGRPLADVLRRLRAPGAPGIGDPREHGDRVKTVVIPDASHALFPEQPTAVAEAIVAWVRTLPP